MEDACIKEMVRRANGPDGLGTQSECIRAIIEWAATQFGDAAPSDTTVRELVGRYWPKD